MIARYYKQLIILAISFMLSVFIARHADLILTDINIELQAEAIRVIICIVLLFLIESTSDQQQIYVPLLLGITAVYFGNLLNFMDDIYEMTHTPINTLEDLFQTFGFISVLIGISLWARYQLTI